MLTCTYDQRSFTMKFSEQIKPISYFRKNAARVIADMIESREPLIISQNGKATCVLQDITSYETTQITIALLKLMATGQNQIDAGKVRPAREVFANMDKAFMK
jgi:PHD/YefM family antitoxin component YafN of YafNO toxin-antitoxin module